ncbi:MAG: DUF3473 domain-containing protein [Treponema sp.]|nr:DUF3473 domain-containing protein [Treponema sp.]
MFANDLERSGSGGYYRTKGTLFSGGGYFRLFPYPLIRHWAKQTSYLMTYFHPRDFDAKQPVITGLSFSRKFKSYVGLSGAYHKLQKLLGDFKFIDIATADSLIDWEQVRTIGIITKIRLPADLFFGVPGISNNFNEQFPSASGFLVIQKVY